MDIKLLKNPIVIGIIMFSITFAYLYWDNDRKCKKNPNIKKKYDIVSPAIVGVFSWFIAANYFDNEIINVPLNNNADTNNILLGSGTNDLINKNSIGDVNFQKTGKIISQDGINIPINMDANMPDMFIELDNFS